MIEEAERERPDHAGHADHRADQRQYGHCAGLRRRGRGLQADPDHARDDVPSSGARCSRCSARKLVLTPAKDGMSGAIAKAEELHAGDSGLVDPDAIL